MVALDSAQLPPVCDKPAYLAAQVLHSPFAAVTRALLHGAAFACAFNMVVVLTEIKRQASGPFAELLTRLRSLAGTFTAADVDLLQARHHLTLPAQVVAELEGEVYITATREDCRLHNCSRLLASKAPIARFLAEGPPGDDEDYGGLVEELFLAPGARVALTTNLSVPSRLTNGSMGHVVRIVYGDVDDELAARQPVCVAVRFDDVSLLHPAHPDDPRVVDIVPVLHRHSKSASTRRQMPLRLMWAMTIHGAQGRQYDRGNVNLGLTDITPNALPVQLSRFTSLDHVVVHGPLPTKARLEAAVQPKRLRTRVEAEVRSLRSAADTMAANKLLLPSTVHAAADAYSIDVRRRADAMEASLRAQLAEAVAVDSAAAAAKLAVVVARNLLLPSAVPGAPAAGSGLAAGRGGVAPRGMRGSSARGRGRGRGGRRGGVPSLPAAGSARGGAGGARTRGTIAGPAPTGRGAGRGRGAPGAGRGRGCGGAGQ
jgi:hypothetical protein